jgi:hypothetical protein
VQEGYDVIAHFGLALIEHDRRKISGAARKSAGKSHSRNTGFRSIPTICASTHV